MKKLLIIILLILNYNNCFSANEQLPFLDVKVWDELYNDLNTLYKNHVIKETRDNMFHPDTLIPRDEFVAIVVWIWCKECINPNTEDFIKYDSLPFLDINKLSPYFYCVSIGKNDWIIQWYLLNDKQEYTCQNKTTYKEIPFCPTNNITRIEAATVLLRSAKIWNDELNSKTDKSMMIADVDDKWYWFAKKWIEVWILSKDNNNKIFPNEYINKREFVHMAVKIFWMNFCEAKTSKNTISWDIKVFDKDYRGSCSWEWEESKLDKPEESIYDIVWYTESSWNFNYFWQFRNTTTWETRTLSGRCLNNYDLVSNGKRIIKLIIQDTKSSKSVTTYSQIYVDKKQQYKLRVNINANPILWEAPLFVNFTSIVTWAVWTIEYFWDLWDYNYTDQINPTHTYQNNWIYTVSLKVRDSVWNTWIAELAIEVVQTIDTDKDWIKDTNDSCPKVYWLKQNNWCPVVIEYKKEIIANPCLANKVSTNWWIEWLLSCNSCPCIVSVNFLTSIRDCDILFPAITSPNKWTIYSRWSIYQIN